MSLFLNLYTLQDRFESNLRSEQSLSAAENAQNRASVLEWKVNKLILINMALVELLTAHAGLTEAQLLEKMQEIDLRDGKLDGKVSETTSAVCEQCGKTYSKRHNRCLYCAHVNTGDGVGF
jgi:hypothetical protein